MGKIPGKCQNLAEQTHRFGTLRGVCCFQAEEADDDDIYNVLSTLKRLTAFHKYAACCFSFCPFFEIVFVSSFKSENNEIAIDNIWSTNLHLTSLMSD